MNNENSANTTHKEAQTEELAMNMFEQLNDKQKDIFLETLRAIVAAQDEEEEHKRKEHLLDMYGIGIDEMLRIDSAVDSYTVCAGYIFDAWEKKTKAMSPEYSASAHKWRYIQTFFFPFLFECGRIFGVRQERKRRRKP